MSQYEFHFTCLLPLLDSSSPQFRRRSSRVESCCSPTLRYIHSLLRRSPLAPRRVLTRRNRAIPSRSEPVHRSSRARFTTYLHRPRTRPCTYLRVCTRLDLAPADVIWFVHVYRLARPLAPSATPLSREPAINKLYYAARIRVAKGLSTRETRKTRVATRSTPTHRPVAFHSVYTRCLGLATYPDNWLLYKNTGWEARTKFLSCDDFFFFFFFFWENWGCRLWFSV